MSLITEIGEAREPAATMMNSKSILSLHEDLGMQLLLSASRWHLINARKLFAKKVEYTNGKKPALHIKPNNLEAGSLSMSDTLSLSQYVPEGISDPLTGDWRGIEKKYPGPFEFLGT